MELTGRPETPTPGPIGESTGYALRGAGRFHDEGYVTRGVKKGGTGKTD